MVDTVKKMVIHNCIYTTYIVIHTVSPKMLCPDLFCITTPWVDINNSCDYSFKLRYMHGQPLCAFPKTYYPLHC